MVSITVIRCDSARNERPQSPDTADSVVNPSHAITHYLKQKIPTSVLVTYQTKMFTYMSNPMYISRQGLLKNLVCSINF